MISANTNRSLHSLIFKKYSWLFILLVAIGGLWYPELGLLMLPIMVTLVILGLLKGKYWCGNLCPHGSLFDYVISPLSKNRKVPEIFKGKILQGILFIWFMYMMTKRVIIVTQSWGSHTFFNKLGFIFVLNYLVVTIVSVILAVIFKPRAWCHICPMGTFQVILYKLGKILKINGRTDIKIKLTDREKCLNCGKCARICPVDIEPHIEVADDNILQKSNCIKCGKCITGCPLDVLSFDKTK